MLDRHPQAVILSGLNVLQVLEDHAGQHFETVLYNGPRAYSGQGWAAGVVWFRARGLHHYRRVTLFGLWVVARDEQTELLVGTKTLPYGAPVYNPEAYLQLIRRDYQIYYPDDGSPPPDQTITTHILYNPEERLAMRQAVSAALLDWLQLHAP
jgi:hypothetical protein